MATEDIHNLLMPIGIHKETCPIYMHYTVHGLSADNISFRPLDQVPPQYKELYMHIEYSCLSRYLLLVYWAKQNIR